jgi:hypothetical protein
MAAAFLFSLFDCAERRDAHGETLDIFAAQGETTSGPRRLVSTMRHSDGQAPISPSAAFEKSGPCLAQRRQIFPIGYRIFDEANDLPTEDHHLQKKRGCKQGWGTSHDRLHRRDAYSYCFPTR